MAKAARIPSTGGMGCTALALALVIGCGDHPAMADSHAGATSTGGERAPHRHGGTGASEARRLASEDLRCLALNIYWEARAGDGIAQQAVAAVTLNRVRDPAFPRTVCAVVRQGGASIGCQFSWACDGRNDTPSDAIKWEQAKRIATRGMDLLRDDPTSGALYFHSTRVRPRWAGKLRMTARIGGNVFYGRVTPDGIGRQAGRRSATLAALP